MIMAMCDGILFSPTSFSSLFSYVWYAVLEMTREISFLIDYAPWMNLTFSSYRY